MAAVADLIMHYLADQIRQSDMVFRSCFSWLFARLQAQITANKKFSLRYFMNIFSINGWCFQYRLPLLHQFKHSWYYPPHLFRRLERKFWLWLFCKNMKHSLILNFLPFVHFSGDHKYQHFLDTKWSFA